MRKLFVSLTLLLAVSLSACGGNKNAPAPSPNLGTAPTPGAGEAPTVDAQTVFKQNCVSCHGVNLEGNVGPNLQKVGAKYPKDQIVTIVSTGRGAMPSFKGRLTDNQISAIADWLSAKK